LRSPIPLLGAPLAPLSGTRKDVEAGGLDIAFTVPNRKSPEVAENSGFGRASGREQYASREVFAQGLESLPDGARGEFSISPRFRRKGIIVDPFGWPGHQVG
jgi:hypothetical protein